MFVLEFSLIAPRVFKRTVIDTERERGREREIERVRGREREREKDYSSKIIYILYVLRWSARRSEKETM